VSLRRYQHRPPFRIHTQEGVGTVEVKSFSKIIESAPFRPGGHNHYKKNISDCQEMDTERGGRRMNINVKCAIVAAVAGLLSAIIVNIIFRV